jgi:hypothetical protein
MSNHHIIEEYLNCVYDGFDTSIINFPTAAGAMNFLLKIIANKSQEKRQTTLILVRNGMMKDHMYFEFCNEMNEFGGKNNINTFYEFKNGSTIFFKTYNQVEHPIFDHSDNVIFFNIDLKRNNKPTLEMLDKVNTYNKKLFINCNIREGVEIVIARKIKDDIYVKTWYCDVSDMPLDIRKFKLRKIKEKMS